MKREAVAMLALIPAVVASLLIATPVLATGVTGATSVAAHGFPVKPSGVKAPVPTSIPSTVQGACPEPFWVWLTWSNTTMSDGHSLEADLYGLYSLASGPTAGMFCGTMAAASLATAQPHTAGGWVATTVLDCSGNAVERSWISLPSGGLYGSSAGTWVQANVPCAAAGTLLWETSWPWNIGGTKTPNVIG